MTLRKKTLLIVGLTIVVLIGVLYAISATILMGGFNDLEHQDTVRNTERAVAALNNDLADLDTMLADWSVWDDTYEFVLDANEDYVESNLVDSTFTGIPLNLMLFLDADGQQVFAKAFDIEEEEEMPVPSSLAEHLSADTVLVEHSDIESSTLGIVLLDEGPMMIASRPILNSAGEGPIRGTMVMGRYLDSSEVDEIAERTQLALAVHAYADAEIPSDFQAAWSDLSEGASVVVQTLGDESIAGYAAIQDVYGQPALILGAEMPRGIHDQGLASNRYLIISLIIVGLAFIGLTVLTLERLILSRLSRLSVAVGRIGTSGDIAARVPVTGADELSNLGHTINNTLIALEQSQADLRRSEQKNRAILETIPDAIIQMEGDGTILTYKPPTNNGLAFSSADITGKNIDQVMPAGVAQQAADSLAQAMQSNAPQTFEYRLPTNTGEVREYEAEMVPSGENEVLAIMRDITDRKKAEETKKKEVLLKETHHRVNNNLQVIASLLKLQASYVKDEAAADMFRESQDRVKSMAIIHEKLYQSGGVTGEIDFGEYVRDLTNHLFRSYGVTQDTVKLQADVPDVQLGLDTALPCGQIVNELVSNSLKHAFPNGKQGEVRISLARVNGNGYTLTVSDDGIGLPENTDLENATSLGLELVVTLVDQIGGTITLERNDGTTFAITFDEPGHDEYGR